MTPEELQKLVESNAKAIEALANRQIESQRATDHQIAELTRTVGDFVRTTNTAVSALVQNTGAAVSGLIDDRATMYELVSQVSESQASINESMSQIAAAIILLSNRES